jgi:arylsulfatase A
MPVSLSADRTRHAGRMLLMLIAVLVGACGPKSTDLAAGEKPPHMLVLFVDDMGYGDLSSYNSASRIPTPRIDALAREGMRFTDAHAPGALCHPSRYGLLTGRYPFRTDVSVWPRQPLIEQDRMTIASLLQSHGYRTSMVGKWHLGFDESGGYEARLPGGPVNRGFDTFFGIRASTDIPPYFYIRGDRATRPPTGTVAANSSSGWSPIQGAFWRAGGIAPGLELVDVLPCFINESIQVIRDHAAESPERPLFLYLALPAPHTPWLPTARFAGKSGAGMYGDFVAMVDAEIGRVLDVLGETGMTENTLVIFASDNGPVWYDRDAERFGHDSSGGLRGMKADAYEGGHRMPFIVSWPGKVAPGSVTGQTISFTDMLATFAAIVGDELPKNAGEDSFNLLPVLVGDWPEAKPVRPPVVSMSAQGMRAIQDGRWKLIEGPGSGGFADPQADPLAAADPTSRESNANDPADRDRPEGQLYDLEADLAETTNLWHDHPDVVERLQSLLDEIDRSGRSRR